MKDNELLFDLTGYQPKLAGWDKSTENQSKTAGNKSKSNGTAFKKIGMLHEYKNPKPLHILKYISAIV